MNLSFRVVKLFHILLFVIFISSQVMPLVSAGPLQKIYKCEARFKVEYDKTVFDKPLIPLDRAYEIPIKISCIINGLLANIVAETYDDVLFLDVFVKYAPEWCIATVDPPMIEIPISADWQTVNSTVYLILKENAPAFEREHLEIEVEMHLSVGMTATIIPKGNASLVIPFQVGYIPILNINSTNGYYKIVNPYQTATFNINIKNMGNGRTIVESKIIKVPKGWSAKIASEVTLGSKVKGDDPKKTLTLTVKPSYSFGYHEEQGVVTVSIRPISADDPSLKGEEYVLSFVVQNHGFSLPGFESLSSLVIFVCIALLARKTASGGYLTKYAH